MLPGGRCIILKRISWTGPLACMSFCARGSFDGEMGEKGVLVWVVLRFRRWCFSILALSPPSVVQLARY